MAAKRGRCLLSPSAGFPGPRAQRLLKGQRASARRRLPLGALPGPAYAHWSLAREGEAGLVSDTLRAERALLPAQALQRVVRCQGVCNWQGAGEENINELLSAPDSLYSFSRSCLQEVLRGLSRGHTASLRIPFDIYLCPLHDSKNLDGRRHLSDVSVSRPVFRHSPSGMKRGSLPLFSSL